MNGEAYLPPEIINEILSRVDVKSLLVLKCVCKLWCSIIEDQHFVQMHMRRSKVTYPRDEILYKDGDDKDFQLLGVCRNGLLLEKHGTKNTFRIRNPATKIKLCLPDPSHKLAKFSILVHLPTSDNYKVVSVFADESNKFGGCQVLTLGIDSAWRALEIPILHRLNGRQLHGGLCVLTDDVAYIMWFSHVDASPVARDIVCIEMETEGFVTVRAPETFFASWDNVRPVRWEDKLSLSKHVGQELHVWVLEDYKSLKWGDRKITISLSFLSKHSNISDKFYTYKLTKLGWLYFVDNYGKFRICYHVESGRENIFDDPYKALPMKFTLVNPYKLSRMPPLPPQPTQAVLNRNYSLSSSFIQILDFLGRLCFFPKE